MTDRRDYFRLRLDAHVELHLLEQKPLSIDDANAHFAFNHILQTLFELKKLDTEGNQLQQQIKEADRALGEYLHIVNRKVDALAQYCLNTGTESELATQTIELSEGGLLLHNDAPLPQGQWLALMLRFNSPLMVIALHAQVVRCEPDRGNGYQIAAEFHYANATERQQISQHIMRAQMELARRKSPHSDTAAGEQPKDFT
jgi:hypothetical protein